MMICNMICDFMIDSFTSFEVEKSLSRMLLLHKSTIFFCLVGVFFRGVDQVENEPT